MLLAGDAGKLNPEQTDFVKNIFDSNERMLHLVKDLLDISRIESGRIIIDPEKSDITKLVDHVIGDIKPMLDKKNQTLTKKYEKSISSITMDTNLVHNVVQNLLTNAIKYTPEKGKIKVNIKLHDSDNIVISVGDNGYGIPRDQQDQTFHKFFRATNAVKKETEGTGLGLYLVKSVVESSGGKIWFESSEGKGTVFYFTLPIAGVAPKKGEIHLGS